MTQEIITYLIITFAFGYAFYKFIQQLLPQKNAPISSCSGGCQGCSAGTKSNLKKYKAVHYKKM